MSRFKSKSGKSDNNSIDVLKELNELKDFNHNYQSKIFETQSSRQNSFMISDYNDVDKLFNGSEKDSQTPKDDWPQGLSFLEKEFKEGELKLLEENIRIKKMMKEANPEMYNNLNNESTTSDYFQEAMVMYKRDFKKMKAELKEKMNKENTTPNDQEEKKVKHEEEKDKNSKM